MPRASARSWKDPGEDSGFSRRELLRTGALSTLAVALGEIAAMAGPRGLIDSALAITPDLTVDTLNGLLAFVVPGNDEYSQHQAESTDRPGGVGSQAVLPLIYDLDKSVPASVFGSQGETIPASHGVAGLLNSYALRVNPLALGSFASPFARLSFAEKAEVFKLLESELEPSGSELAFVAGIIQGLATSLAFSEAGVFDPQTRQPTSQPVGWGLTHYDGPSDGWPEFRGYYHHRRRVKGAGPNATRAPR